MKTDYGCADRFFRVEKNYENQAKIKFRLNTKLIKGGKSKGDILPLTYNNI